MGKSLVNVPEGVLIIITTSVCFFRSFSRGASDALSLSFTAASVAKKNVEGHHLLLENESERDKSSESKSYIFYTYSIISGKASTKTTSAETVILRLLSKVKQSQLASNDLRGQLNH